MDVESTLVIVKPDAVRRNLIGEIIVRMERKGLTVEGLKMMTIDRDLAERHYDIHKEKPFFGELVDFITSGPVVVAKIRGHRAIEAVRTLMGSTDPVQAPPGTIRGDFALVITENMVHGSDSPESAEKEIKLFFG